MEIDNKDNYKKSYNKLNKSVNDINNNGKYASWLILGVFIGRGYQYLHNFKKYTQRRNKRRKR